MERIRTGDDESRAIPGAICFEFWRASNYAAIDHFDVRSGGCDVVICLSSCARTYSIQVDEVQSIAAFPEARISGGGDNAIRDGLRVALWCDREYVVGFVT